MSNEVENELGIVENHCVWLGVGAPDVSDLGEKRYREISNHLEVVFCLASGQPGLLAQVEGEIDRGRTRC